MGGKSWVAIHPFIHCVVHAIISVRHLHVPGAMLGRCSPQRPPCPPGVHGHAGTGSSIS